MKKWLFYAAGIFGFGLVTLVSGSAIAQTTGLAGALPKQMKIPPASEAFRAEASAAKPGHITLDIVGIPGTYFYRDKIKVDAAAKPLKIGKLALPPAAMVDDETFGRVAIYRGGQQIDVPYTGGGKANLTITMQGCHEEAKICYPPQQFKLVVDAPKNTTVSEQNSGRSSSKTAEIAPQVLTASKPAAALTNAPIRTTAALDAAIASAKGKYVMVDVWATWCAPCKEMERTTLADASVRAALEKDFVLLKADVTAPGPGSSGILKRYSLPGPPGFVFYGPNGKEISGARLMGFTPTEKFLSHLKLVTS